MTYQIAVDGFDDGFAAECHREHPVGHRRTQPPPVAAATEIARRWLSYLGAAADGTALNSTRAAHIEVHALATVDQTPNTATRLNSTLSLSDGELWLDDLTSPGPAMRFYRVIERTQ